ncbi:hypothetical protein LNP04_14050 [Chryseobacterium sp. C-71]|uniref:hypothetical protein n=1 Tax=Chryseobacterium sp. C-71 TaxID=2893882 RepID=UPI001E550EFE|nr:hypothetical protein [Chryseobacterium sp. C-71]UFH31090.1 hypothetical protein LNP04_14050 [Chryseobacterium sp. C-71]
MKKISTIFFLSFSMGMVYAQTGNVGINTNNPQQKLHIGGSSSVVDSNIGTTGVQLVSPTIRIDGLNSTNNPTVFTSTETTNPVYVNASGISSTVKGVQLFSNTAVGGDAITTPVTLSNPTLAGTVPSVRSTGALATVSFTLTQRSVVYIASSLSARVIDTSGNPLVETNHKIIASNIIFDLAPASTGLQGTGATRNFSSTDTAIYTNGVANSINTITLSPSSELILPAGSYTINLYGITGGATQRPEYRVVFGEGARDKLNVFAKPL